MSLCCPQTRGRLFNWVTILLLTGWMGLVTLVGELKLESVAVETATMAEDADQAGRH